MNEGWCGMVWCSVEWNGMGLVDSIQTDGFASTLEK
jgi:hypothetical protein